MQQCKSKDVHCSISYDSEKVETSLIPNSRRLIRVWFNRTREYSSANKIIVEKESYHMGKCSLAIVKWEIKL